MKCMQSSPTNFPEIPAAHSLYDDFVAVHLNQTMNIHVTVLAPARFYTLAPC